MKRKRKISRLKAIARSRLKTTRADLVKTIAELRQEQDESRELIITMTKEIDSLKTPTVSPFVWVSADGRRLKPREMDEEHLRNTICYLQRILVAKFGTVRYLSTTTTWVQALWEMLKEARNRGLDV